MTKLFKIEHNAETGEVKEIQLTAAELKEIELQDAEAKAIANAETAKAVEKAALLVKLGITEDEAKLLLS